MNATRNLVPFLLLLAAGPADALCQAPAGAGAKSIPFDHLGAEAQKQYSGDGIGVTPAKDGATLRTAFQRLEGQATAEGLWLTSTADEDKGKESRFQVRMARWPHWPWSPMEACTPAVPSRLQETPLPTGWQSGTAASGAPWARE